MIVVNGVVPESLCLLRQLLSDVTTHEYSLQVDPQVLDNQPIFNDLCGACQLLHPFLDLRLEGCIVTIAHQGTQHHQAVLHQGHCLSRSVT